MAVASDEVVGVPAASAFFTEDGTVMTDNIITTAINNVNKLVML